MAPITSSSRRLPLPGAIAALSALCALCAAGAASAGELVEWSEQASQNFSAQQCVVIKGTPGTPEHCAPSVESPPYPCGNLKHPTKTCRHTIPGPCSPPIPSTPDVKQCGSINLGQFGIKVDGGVYTAMQGISDSQIAVQNTISVTLFGKQEVLPMRCTAAVGTKTSICLNLLTRTFDRNNVSGLSCTIDGASVASISTPGVTANLCTDLSFDLAGKTPKGSAKARVEANIDFGSLSIGGQGVSMGSVGWNPTMFGLSF